MLLPWIISNESCIFDTFPWDSDFLVVKMAHISYIPWLLSTATSFEIPVWRRSPWKRRKLQSLLNLLRWKVTYLNNQLYQISPTRTTDFYFQARFQVQKSWPCEKSPLSPNYSGSQVWLGGREPGWQSWTDNMLWGRHNVYLVPKGSSNVQIVLRKRWD